MKGNIYRIAALLMFVLMIYFMVRGIFVGADLWSQWDIFIYLVLAVLCGFIGYKLIGKGWDDTEKEKDMDISQKWSWGKFFFVLWLVLLLLGLIFSSTLFQIHFELMDFVSF